MDGARAREPNGYSKTAAYHAKATLAREHHPIQRGEALGVGEGPLGGDAHHAGWPDNQAPVTSAAQVHGDIDAVGRAQRLRQDEWHRVAASGCYGAPEVHDAGDSAGRGVRGAVL